jgi:predicted  nucleic acid-binding Zn-ribbon protein
MYRVVGCRECGALWIVADRPETTTCPRCGKRHPFERLHAFAETEDEDSARQARAALLADRAGQGEAFAGVDDELAGQLDFEAVSEASYLEEAGLDPEAVAEAGERATAGPARSRNRRETVLAALDELDRPTEAEVVEYAAERDVPAQAVSGLLERLVEAGELSESGGRYRRL